MFELYLKNAVLTTIAAVDGRTTDGGYGCCQARRERERTCSVAVVYVSSVAGELFRHQTPLLPVFLETAETTDRFPLFSIAVSFGSSHCRSSSTAAEQNHHRR
ncbi:hypothetical protein PIB30_025778 [Stylosanthes scabra]|uniref:Uncharacterized protein n=1 Tax=Stylosanthes scabra TaxID=79078 RepID=A0ABU6SAT5_9FABA|nr:hypothetical protein [Stylosanthes scabra]